MANEQLSMDDILGGKDPAPSAPAPEAPAAPAAAPKESAPPPEAPKVDRPVSRKQAHRDLEQDAQGRVRDPETGQYAPKVEKQAEAAPAAPVPAAPAKPATLVAAPQQDLTEKEKAFLRMGHEERTKRQELERRLAAIEAKATPAVPAQTDNTFWNDPEGALAKQRQEVNAAIMSTRMATSEMIARTRYPDFDEKVAEFSKLATSNPWIGQQFANAPDPAEFAYRTAKNKMELDQAGGIEALKLKITKETEASVRARIEAELKDKAEALAKERAALPPSLSEARSTGVNRPVWGGVPSMDDILKG